MVRQRREAILMEFLRSVLKILDTQMNVPQLYGAYHIFCLLLTGVLTVYAVRRSRHDDERKVRRVVFLTAAVVALLEVYKQINFTFGDGTAAPAYQWYAFPWQFCSTPMFVGLLTGIFRMGRIHNALCAYLSTYAVFAGAAVMFYPVTVFTGTVGINIQTMVCHGSMVVIGGYLLGSGHVEMKPRTVLRAMPVFAICVALASIMNHVAHVNGITDFNMFFISPHGKCDLPVYSVIHEAVPFPVNVMIYFLGFSLAAFAVVLLARGICWLSQRRPVPAAL